ncbi:MAG TPA: DUF3368 domain-containing protein [Bryobacteraceae bacterium]
MIVIADTGPINYLILIGEIQLLPVLYGHVVIPASVAAELGRQSAPKLVSDWIAIAPAWLTIMSPARDADEGVQGLDPGERDAILLAEELQADRLIIDEMHGRRVAASRGIRSIGIVGVLLTAAEGGLMDLKRAVERLQETNFRASKELWDRLLALARNQS